MSLIGNSGQKVGDGSTAIQAGNDVVIGNTTSEIVTICELVVASKMSSLKEEAMMVAMERAQEFGTKVAMNIASNLDEKIENKLKDPDIQYAISQAVVQVATKGINEKNDLLQELIISKINNDDEDHDLIIDLALETTKRTTSSELKLLGLISYFRFCSKTFNNLNITQLLDSYNNGKEVIGFNKDACQQLFKVIYETPSIDFDKITGGTDTIKPIDTSMMEIKGLIQTDKHFATSYFDILEARTGIILSNNQQIFEENFPVLDTILKSFNIETLDKLNSIVLSPVGNVIGKDYLKARGFFSK
ncbi:hypothetical protein KQL91_002386 [Escherichia coli]|uniref:LPO_1073/Vpar_1526 family protein n=1 Tax=Escherichia coli TaxID=562 RepID=UPI00180C4226|nr:LPO_1073/Vpar_1526 family protein [Escherichia coli]EFC1230567.1 hypothetical protein [Escherichia coli]EFC5177119.1 hypothetical protein [Escherichia coli]EFD5095488.1 hypothetical protein [Escherichia coli]EFO1247249.1 hypothetical protein [Escherichia coli]EHP9616992.1 hypothetical protein [Escherichia coli]